MKHIFLALAGLALVAPTLVAAHAIPQSHAQVKIKTKASAKTKPKAKPKPKPSAPAILPSADATRVADWIAASADNHALPYAIVDKNNAALFLFDAKGKSLGAVPVLIGLAVGDEASPGIGAKNLAEIGPAEKTTPAGRFLAKFGLAFGKEKILWVDYADSVALHPIPPTVSKKEHRRERLLSPTPDDNRISFGCINVPLAFYTKAIKPQFLKKGGYVYVMPDTKPLEDVFPNLRVEPYRNGGAR